jgi:hypothetical protein
MYFNHELNRQASYFENYLGKISDLCKIASTVLNFPQAPAGGPEGDVWTKLIFSFPIRKLKQII